MKKHRLHAKAKEDDNIGKKNANKHCNIVRNVLKDDSKSETL